MADDERRAEIEAWTCRCGHITRAARCEDCGRLRDARGDDEAGRAHRHDWRTTGMVDTGHQPPFREWECDCGEREWTDDDDGPARYPQGEDHETMFDVEPQSWEETAKSLMREKVERTAQGEDHEAGIVEVHLSDCCLWPKMHTRGGDGSYGEPCWTVCQKCGQDCEPVPFARVSPSRDGSVAVEDVTEWLAHRTAMLTAPQVIRLVQEFRAEFSPASTGDQAPKEENDRGRH